MNNNIPNQVMQFQETTNRQWSMMESHLPKSARTVHSGCDDRTTINGIIYVLISGCRWAEMPKRYGSKSSAKKRLQDGQQKGVWKKILKCITASANKSGKLNLQKISVDSSSISAKKGRDVIGFDGFKRITGIKIHAAAGQNVLPVSIVCSPANIHDSTKFIDVMEPVSDFVDYNSIRQVASCLADKGYDAKYVRNYLRDSGIDYCIPYKRNSGIILQDNIQNNGCSNYNKTGFVVEGFFAWLKCGFHKTRIRCEKNCDNYPSFAYLASILMYWRVLGWVVY